MSNEYTHYRQHYPKTSRHWLLFDKDRQVVGCHCGYEASLDYDCGYGDSVVEHLIAVGAKR